MRLQLKDPQDTDRVLAPITVEASPRAAVAKEASVGRYNFVLLRRNDENDDIGIRSEFSFLKCYFIELTTLFLESGCTVAQIRVIFIPNYTHEHMLQVPLVYVQPLISTQI